MLMPWLQTGLTMLVLGITYLGLAMGQWPGLPLNRAAIALVGAAAVMGLGVVTLPQAWQAIDPTTIVFLFSLMIVNLYLGYGGFFNLALQQMLGLTRSPWGLVVLLSVGSGLLSAFFLNDTLVLVGTPLVLAMTAALNLNPIPYLLALAGATNIGSVATLSGNPQNILIGSLSGISYGLFVRQLAPVAILGIGIQLAWLWWLYPEIRVWEPVPVMALPKLRLLQPLLTKSLWVAGLMLVGFMVGLPLGPVALTAAAVLLVISGIKAERVLRQVDGMLLLLFAGLFILTQATRHLNLLQSLTPVVANPWGLAGLTVVLSNLISNVPAVLLLTPLIAPDDTQAWLLLAASSTLAGNLSLFGSVANLIMVEAARSKGHHLSFREHLRFGLPLTLVTVGLAYVWVYNVEIS
ncbi:anion transporter [Synechococcus sp. PCC 6312]|uniref:anion transporter n=1 Tax=Synechococcus sp. (strain ATCC 27167 / PCC 6312) TaxID=195253 RepID=UPI0002F232C8|nr:anion transporter [Synechococcus sp. PCC 6312]